MNYPIIMIPTKIKHRLYPFEYRHVSVSIIAAKSMKDQKGKQKDIGGIGKTEHPIGHNEQ